MADRSALTSERLDEAWMLLFDLGQQDGRRVSMADRATLQEARYIVNRFQLYVGKGTRKEGDNEKAADADTPAAQGEDT